jgi:hypothetical protein
VNKAYLVFLLAAACGGDDSGNNPDPAVIAGGGIGSGAIDGVVNLYAIDDATREPIEGASVTIGDVSGTTDADGLFVAEGLTGPQTVIATAAGYRSEVWVGANGANMTMNLKPQNVTVPQATLAGSITGFAGISVPSGHLKLALVTYSQTDGLGDEANNLKTPQNKNGCLVAASADCNFEVVTRAGTISLVALIFDYNTNNTPADATDDTTTLIGYATKTGIAVMSGVNQTGLALTLVSDNQLATETVEMGTPPAGLTPALGIIGVELGDDSGVFQLPVINATTTSSIVPALAGLPGSSQYRLTAIAQSSAMPPTQSFVIRRHLTSATLSAGAWTTPPADVSVSHTHASWTPSPEGTVHGVEYFSTTTSVLNLSSFDGSSSFDIPAAVQLPSGDLTAKVTALTGDGLDLMDFALDRDRDKIVAAGVTPAQVN